MRTAADRPAGRRQVAVLVVLAFLGACSHGSSTAAPSTSGLATSGPATTAPLVLGAGQTLHRLATTFEYAGFLVTLGDTVFDAPRHELAVAVRFTNIGGQWTEPELAATLTDGGASAPMLADPVTVPPHQSAESTVTFPGLDHDPTATGTVAWGRPDRDVATIHLADGSLDNGWYPAPVALDAWGSVGKYSVHLTGGTLLVGNLDLDAQSPSGERVLRLTFDEWAAVQDPVNGFYPVEHLTLERPDGTKVTSDQSSDGVAPVSWTATAGNWIEFPVAAKFQGHYRLLLSSLSTKGFSTFHPELLEQTALEFDVGATVPTAPAVTDPPRPDVSVLHDPGVEPTPTGTPLDLALTGSPVNVGGFVFQPSHLTWDPTARTAELTGTAQLLETDDSAPVDPTSAAGQAAGLLDSPPQFSFSALLASGGRTFSGIFPEPVAADPQQPTPVTIQFLLVDRLDPTDLGLEIGSPHSVPSTVPLTTGSRLGLSPPLPKQAGVTAPKVTAGEWSIHLVSYRLGLLQTALPPPPGQTELELTMDVTIAPDAQPKALGLSFRPSVQVFLARPDGYLQQAVGDGGLVQFVPGATHRERVVFHVPDSFQPGPLGVVLRGGDETADVTTDVFPETTFTAVLGGIAGGGL